METKKNIENFDDEKILSSINKESNFSVPENYFDYLPEKIMSRIRIHSNQKPSTFFIFRPVVAFSSIIILSGIIYLFTFLLRKDISPSYENELSVTILSDTEIQNVIDNPALYNIDENKITEEYLASNYSENSEENENAEVNISDDEIKTYLEENTDINYNTNESQTTQQ